MAPAVGGPLANVITATAASDGMEITRVSTVPFQASAFGSENCLLTATNQIPIVNTVHSLHSSFTSNGFVPVPVHVDIVLYGSRSLTLSTYHMFLFIQMIGFFSV